MKKPQTKRIVGLAYSPDKGLPRVVLKGAGRAVDEVIQRRDAMVDGPPVVNDEKLLEQLYRLPVDSEIGPELFQLVAALLVHIYAVEGKLKEMRE